MPLGALKALSRWTATRPYPTIEAGGQSLQALRDYQRTAVSTVKRLWSQGKRSVLLVLPTGSGKTTVAAHIVMQTPGRVLFLCPWRELVRQAVERLEEHNVTAVSLLDGRKDTRNTDAVVSTTATAARRDLGEFRLIIVDEAHRAAAAQCRAILKKYPRARILGLTATPVRQDGKRLGSIFDELVEPITAGDLIARKTLAQPVLYAPQTPLNLDSIRIDPRSKDYAPRALGNRMMKPKIMGDAVKHWEKHARNLRTVAYCTTLQHADAYAEALRKRGANVEVIKGSTCNTKRKELFEALVSRDLNVLVNVGVLTEGIDIPEIECQQLLRPTKSLGLHIQICGRGLRVAPGKTSCLYLDHADNFRNHGWPQDKRKWSLTKKERADPKIGKKPPLIQVQCPRCKSLVPAGSAECPKCQHPFLPVAALGDLVPVRWSPANLR